MIASYKLSDHIRLRQRFARSVNVERDADSETVAGYLPTARALDVIERVAAGMIDASAGRAISITGPYGSGKSSLALFLDALFSGEGEPIRHAADRVLG